MSQLELINMGEVTRQEVDWLYYPYLPFGKISPMLMSSSWLISPPLRRGGSLAASPSGMGHAFFLRNDSSSARISSWMFFVGI